LIAKNLMQAHAWGIKTFYYSLINKAGSKSVDAVKEDKIEEVIVELEDNNDDDCEACKL
jgi:hypothetical protein